jgi:hypothetical protein
MNRSLLPFVVALALASQSCIWDITSSLTLSPSGVLTIQTDPSATSGSTGTLTFSPSSGGSAYTTAKSRIDAASIKSLTFTVNNVYSDNMATTLTSGTVTLLDTVTGDSATYTLPGPLMGINTVGTPNTFTKFDPDPAAFMLKVLKAGDDFTASASGSIDQAPAHIDLKVSIDASFSASPF